MKKFCSHCAGTQLQYVRPAYFLPTDVVPATLPGDEPEYYLRIAPVIEGDAPHFEGSVMIVVDVRNSVREFPINAVEMEIEDVTFLDSNGVFHTGRVREEADKEQVRLCFDEYLPVGRGMITIGKYRAEFNKQLKGFYLSSVVGADGVKTTIGCTQSEPGDFRRWVPSFDQPGPVDYKSRFSISAEVDANLVVRSNGAIIGEEILSSGKKLVRFATTNRLPTYVIALTVGNLESSDPIDVGGVEVRVWAPPGNKHLMDFALEVARRGLPALEEFHGQKYPNIKLDLMAIPGFSAGAMENDGMFTFRMEYVLIHRAAATIAQLLMVAIIVLHEMDHTWDGNRHTMHEWGQLSLNELRATFMSYLIADILFPDFHVWENFALGRTEAMDVDSLKNTRCVVSPVETIEQAMAQFDVITYRKGSAVLRAMQTCLDALVENGFKRGVQAFNRDPRYDWGNALTEELWLAISEETGYDVLGFMEGWTKQPGFPIISVKRAGSTSITLRQSRFTYDTAAPESEQLWQVPVFVHAYSTKDQVKILLHLEEREQTFDLGIEFDLVIVNAGGHGFYHTSYDEELFAAMVKGSQSALTGIERYNLLNDAWAALQTGKLSVKLYFELLVTFRYDDNPNVWRIISMSLAHLGSFGNAETRLLMVSFVESLTEPLYRMLGWNRRDGESSQTTELRGIVLGIIGNLKLPWFERLAVKHAYLPWLNGADIDGDVLSAAVGAIATAGDGFTHGELLDLLNPKVKVLTPQQVTMVLKAICRLREPSLARSTFGKVLSGEIDLQMSGTVIAALLANPHVRDEVWRLVKENFATLVEKLPTNLLIRGIEGVSFLDRVQDEPDVRGFMAAQATSLKGSEVPVSQTLDMQHLNVAIRARCEPELDAIAAELFYLVSGSM
jgi:puromycin-sensitive aminopeptidase